MAGPVERPTSTIFPLTINPTMSSSSLEVTSMSTVSVCRVNNIGTGALASGWFVGIKKFKFETHLGLFFSLALLSILGLLGSGIRAN